MSVKGDWRRRRFTTLEESEVRHALINGTQSEKILACDWFIKNGQEGERNYCKKLREELVKC